MMKPGLRGGAGGVSRRTSGTTAGPACATDRVGAFTFAVRLGATPKTKAKRAAAVAEHLDDVPGAVVIEERAEGDVLRITMAAWPPVRLSQAEAAAEACPQYVARTFAGLGG